MCLQIRENFIRNENNNLNLIANENITTRNTWDYIVLPFRRINIDFLSGFETIPSNNNQLIQEKEIKALTNINEKLKPEISMQQPNKKNFIFKEKRNNIISKVSKKINCNYHHKCKFNRR